MEESHQLDPIQNCQTAPKWWRQGPGLLVVAARSFTKGKGELEGIGGYGMLAEQPEIALPFKMRCAKGRWVVLFRGWRSVLKR